jgi:uncharacterized protein (TIGR02996 family)
MTDDAAFLRAVLDAPGDDAPRLVYADWLEENGQGDRAEFIRVQCELARLPIEDERRPDLEAREVRLLSARRKEWSRPLRPFVKQVEFRRGFAEAVKLRAEAFLEHAEDLFRLAPINTIDFVNIGDHAAAVAGSKHLRKLKGLGLTDSRFLSGQRGTWNRQTYQRERIENPLGPNTLRTVFGSKFLRGIRHLAVPNCQLRAEGVRFLAGWNGLAEIESLDLRNNDFDEGDVAGLAASKHLGNLRTLRMESCFSYDHYEYFPEEGGITIFPRELAPLFGQLEEAHIGSCGVTANGLRHLGSQPRTVPLKGLSLERSPLRMLDNTGEAEIVLAFLSQPLRELNLRSCYLDNMFIRALSETTAAATLVSLEIGNSDLIESDAENLVNSKSLANLQRLEIGGNLRGSWSKSGPLKDNGLVALARGLPRLAWLDVQRNLLTSKSIKVLADSDLGQRLYWLDLRHNRLGDAGARALLAGDWLRLAWLDVRDNGIGDRMKRKLRERFGHAVRFNGGPAVAAAADREDVEG